MASHWMERTRHLLYPSVCLICGTPGGPEMDICTPCREELPYNHHCCRRCALPLPSSSSGSICGACSSNRPLFDRCLSPFIYQSPIDNLVTGFKFRDQFPNGRLLARLFGDFLETRLSTPPELILPVPLHRSRLRQRGFNQALELARPLARRFAIPFQPHLLTRCKKTASQADLSQRARGLNVRNAFSLVRPLQGTHLAVLDDVVTTGATAAELTRLLKQAGARRVEIWAVARTP